MFESSLNYARSLNYVRKLLLIVNSLNPQPSYPSLYLMLNLNSRKSSAEIASHGSHFYFETALGGKRPSTLDLREKPRERLTIWAVNSRVFVLKIVFWLMCNGHYNFSLNSTTTRIQKMIRNWEVKFAFMSKSLVNSPI